MYFLRLVVKNALRHKLRTTLTIVGIVVAISAFGLLRTVIDAWYAGANASSSARLITRNAVSLVFSLPLTYAQRIRQMPGVTAVSWANWFGGVYISERNFFPQFAIDAPTYLEIYPEFLLSAEERKAFLTDRQGAIVGRKLALQKLVTEIVVRDIRRSTDFYRRLGFVLLHDGGNFVELTWEDHRLFLAEASAFRDVNHVELATPPQFPLANIRVMVPKVDEYWRLAREVGARIIVPIADRYYGLRDFTIADPDGFGVRFASILEVR